MNTNAAGKYFKTFESTTGPLTHYDPSGFARSADGKYWDFTHDSWSKGKTIRIGGTPQEFTMGPGDSEFYTFIKY